MNDDNLTKIVMWGTGGFAALAAVGIAIALLGLLGDLVPLLNV